MSLGGVVNHPNSLEVVAHVISDLQAVRPFDRAAGLHKNTSTQNTVALQLTHDEPDQKTTGDNFQWQQ